MRFDESVRVAGILLCMISRLISESGDVNSFFAGVWKPLSIGS